MQGKESQSAAERTGDQSFFFFFFKFEKHLIKFQQQVLQQSKADFHIKKLFFSHLEGGEFRGEWTHEYV